MKRAQKTIAFYVETLLLTVFLLAVLAVLVQLFSAARGMGVEARQKTEAVRIAQNVCAAFEAGADAFAEAAPGDDWSARYGASGAPDADGEYLALVVLSGEPTAGGQLVAARITVLTKQQADRAAGEPLCELETKKYVADNS